MEAVMGRSQRAWGKRGGGSEVKGEGRRKGT